MKATFSNIFSFPFVAFSKLDKTFNIINIPIKAFLWVENLFDTENVVSVYNSTGMPNSDGYLTTAGGQSWIDTALGGAEFGAKLYESRISNPSNYGSPRQIRLGVRVDI